uniref:PCNA-clamp-associated factor n=1 Tax=Heterorhabditis bacteriophora TaxID=37862 RepID=A0A1I7XVN3_HETBA
MKSAPTTRSSIPKSVASSATTTKVPITRTGGKLSDAKGKAFPTTTKITRNSKSTGKSSTSID